MILLSAWQDAQTTKPREPGLYDYKGVPGSVLWFLDAFGKSYKVPGAVHYFYWTGTRWEYDEVPMRVFSGDKWRGVIELWQKK